VQEGPPVSSVVTATCCEPGEATEIGSHGQFPPPHVTSRICPERLQPTHGAPRLVDPPQTTLLLGDPDE
jgi:hypothetical protein